MRKANLWFDYLLAQTEKLELDIWGVVNDFDNGCEIDANKVNELRERATLILSNAENKTQHKKLSRILDSALHNLKCCA